MSTIDVKCTRRIKSKIILFSLKSFQKKLLGFQQNLIGQEKFNKIINWKNFNQKFGKILHFIFKADWISPSFIFVSKCNNSTTTIKSKNTLNTVISTTKKQQRNKTKFTVLLFLKSTLYVKRIFFFVILQKYSTVSFLFACGHICEWTILFLRFNCIL